MVCLTPDVPHNNVEAFRISHVFRLTLCSWKNNDKRNMSLGTWSAPLKSWDLRSWNYLALGAFWKEFTSVRYFPQEETISESEFTWAGATPSFAKRTNFTFTQSRKLSQSRKSTARNSRSRAFSRWCSNHQKIKRKHLDALDHQTITTFIFCKRQLATTKQFARPSH